MASIGGVPGRTKRRTRLAPSPYQNTALHSDLAGRCTSHFGCHGRPRGHWPGRPGRL